MPTILEYTRKKWFMVLGGVFLVFMAVVLFKQLAQKRQIQSEINALRQQADDQGRKNQELQSFIAYLKTDEYKQKAAREQLNLKKNGEFVVSFANPAEPQAGILSQQQPQDTGAISNARKWWNYFFHPDL